MGAVFMGVGILGRRLHQGLRAFLAILGQVAILTAPLLGVLNTAVYGSWPGVDKEGSFLFYEDGVRG